jgi:hypothetical protein
MQIQQLMLMFFGLAMVLVVDGAVVAQVRVYMLFRADWIKWGRDQTHSEKIGEFILQVTLPRGYSFKPKSLACRASEIQVMVRKPQCCYIRL